MIIFQEAPNPAKAGKVINRFNPVILSIYIASYKTCDKQGKSFISHITVLKSTIN